jgi:PAS domain S-box-containing protein
MDELDERDKSIGVEQDKDFILQEQTRLLLQNSTTAIVVNLSIAFLTYLAIPSPQHFWLWMIIGASVLRQAFYFWCRRNSSQSLNFRTIYFIIIALIVVQGSAWGFASIRLYASASDLHKFYLMAIICGMSGGAILTLSPSFLAFACFALSAVSPLVLVLLMEADETFQYAGFMGIVFIIAAHILARRISIFNSALLQSNRSLELISQELAQHRDRLEVLVEARTKELKDSHESYRRLTEEINDAIFELDAVGTIKYISPVIISILGYQPENLIGTLFTELVYQEDLPAAQALFPEIITGNLKPAEYRIVDSTGKPHWVRASIRPILMGNKPIGFRGVLTDIESEKRAESEKKILLQRFHENQKLEAIGTLAAGIAHDFNNLLMGIQGRTSLIAMNLDSSDPNLEHTEAIEEHVLSATSLTTQLLGTAYGGKYDPKPTDLNELVVRTSTMFNRTRKEIQIHSNMSPSPVVAEVDRQQVEQVLLNLYFNSWQAMPDGGEIYLSSAIVTLGDSDCAPYQVSPGRYAKISVADSGVGMDEATRQQVFDPFFTTKEKGRGTGLGLASAYGIINNHDGFITVESKPGNGTTVSIYLPISDKEPYRLSPGVSATIRGSETILLVDDEKMILDVGQALLIQLGYKAIVAKGGEQAVNYMKEKGKEIDLIILDMIMPKMDGSITFDKIRELHPAVPVILSSGYSINEQATQIMRRGCNGFLQKPFGLSELSQKIRSVLDGEETLTNG